MLEIHSKNFVSQARNVSFSLNFLLCLLYHKACSRRPLAKVCTACGQQLVINSEDTESEKIRTRMTQEVKNSITKLEKWKSQAKIILQQKQFSYNTTHQADHFCGENVPKNVVVCILKLDRLIEQPFNQIADVITLYPHPTFS